MGLLKPPTTYTFKEPNIKYNRKGEGGWQIAVSISNSDVMLLSNKDIILQGERGRGSKKAKNLRSYLMYGPQQVRLFDTACLV